MRVLHVINGEHFGGIERAVSLLTTRCADVSPSVVCLMGDDLATVRAAMSACAVDVVRMSHRADVRSTVRLAHAARARGADLMHAHTLRAMLVAAAAGRLAGVPVVATLHSPIARDTEDEGRNRRNARLQRVLVRWTSAIIAVNDRIRRDAVSGGASPDAVTVVRNGIDLSSCAIGDPSRLRASLPAWPREALLVGTHALLRPRKGIDVLIRAMAIVARAVPSAHLVIVGNAESAGYLASLRTLATRVGVGDRVAFLAHRDDVGHVLAALDVFAMPSLYGEGTPFAALEAMAASRCIVAARSEGIDETIEDGITGLLVPPGDHAALAGALVSALGNAPLRGDLGQRARRDAEARFAADRMAADTEAVYRAVLGRRISA